MRILILNHNLRGRGTWNRAWQIGMRLAGRGHAVTLWTVAPEHYYRSAERQDRGVRVLEMPSWSPVAGEDDGWGPLDVTARAFRVLWEPFDLCYAFAHPPNVFIPAWLARRWRGRPLLLDWCDWYERGIFPKRQAMRREGLAGPRKKLLQRRAEKWEIKLERAMPRLADRVTVISTKLATLARQAGRREEEILLLPNGSDVEGIRPLDRDRCRHQLGLDSQGPLIGYVANYHPDQELLLRAFALACAAAPGLRMLKTGPPFSERLVAELKLADRITDLGWVADQRLPMVLGAADALALPMEDNASNRARVPYKFNDYLATGRPILTCGVGNLVKYFIDRPDGERIGLAPEPTADAYGRAMVEIFAPESDREAMGRAARRLAEGELSWAAQVDRLEAFLKDWLGTDPSPVDNLHA